MTAAGPERSRMLNAELVAKREVTNVPESVTRISLRMGAEATKEGRWLVNGWTSSPCLRCTGREPET